MQEKSSVIVKKKAAWFLGITDIRKQSKFLYEIFLKVSLLIKVLVIKYTITLHILRKTIVESSNN